MSAVAAPRAGRARRPRGGRRLRVSVTSALLILACAAVLIGIVTLQVAVLRLNSERGDLQSKRDTLIELQQRAARAARRQARTGSAGGQGDQGRPRAAAGRAAADGLAWPLAGQRRAGRRVGAAALGPRASA